MRKLKPRTKKVLKWTGAIFAVLLLVAGGITYWALDRYIFRHVEISNVAAYEAEAAAKGEAVTTTVTATTEPPVSIAATTTTQPVVITDNSYSSSAMSITIETVVEGEGDSLVTYYVADVTVADATQVRGGFADNKFGANIVADTSVIAKMVGAVFAINGDYYGFRERGIIIRDGVLFRDKGARPGLAMYLDGTMRIYDEEATTGEQLIADGVWNTVSFGPALVDDGKMVEGIGSVEIDTNIGNHSIQGRNPRTGIGMIAPNHFLFIVVDGRSRSHSLGLRMEDFAQLFIDRGATVAYNLDGGGSATMYFNGRVLNKPQGTGDERPTSDILYLAAT